MTFYSILQTQLPKGNPPNLNNLRSQRILEALSWRSGRSVKHPRKCIVTTLPNGTEVCFFKPGKETLRIKPNPHDMRPQIGLEDKRYGFDDVWKQLSKISVSNQEIFKSVLTLVYRNAYMLDHVEIRKGIYRYQPDPSILNCINLLDSLIPNIIEYGLLGLLHFMDIIGWNEDVKYHIERRKPTFKGKYNWKTGRINTLLSCIAVPYKTWLFVENVRNNSLNPINIDWSLAYDTMQLLLRTRGVCPPKQQELLQWLSPYIVVKE